MWRCPQCGVGESAVRAAGSSKRLCVVKLGNLCIPVEKDGRRFLDVRRQRDFQFFSEMRNMEEPLQGRILLLFWVFCPICCSLSVVLYVLEAYMRGKKFWPVMILGCFFFNIFKKASCFSMPQFSPAAVRIELDLLSLQLRHFCQS